MVEMIVAIVTMNRRVNTLATKFAYQTNADNGIWDASK